MHLRIPMVVAALVAGRKSLLPFGWRRTLLKVLAIPVILAGCGGSSPATPAAPTYVQVGGTWRGPVRATQLTGECAESLQFIVGSSTTYTYTLQQNGANVSGVLQVRSATCEVSGIAVAGAPNISLSATRCADRVIDFTCGGELDVQGAVATLTILGNAATGSVTEIHTLTVPVRGSVVGTLTISGEASLTRQ